MIKIFEYNAEKLEEIFAREDANTDVESVVADIIQKVRCEGDKALIELCKEFDKADITDLEVKEVEIQQAFETVGEAFVGILERSAANIRKFHIGQRRKGFDIKSESGAIVGQKILPLEKVGLYIPGGTASYPSSVLMNAIPAKIAGCDEVIMVSPPTCEGTISPVILAAAKIAGVDRIFKVGGAQAVAALAYGTESIPAVYKIVGPGNAFVAEAKKQVFGKVAIDMIAGPSEILVIADDTCNAEFVAADMLSQAEHDKLAQAVLLTDSRELAAAVSEALERQLSLLPRQEIARASIDNMGKIIIVDSMEQAVEVSNKIAPEHLELSMDNPFEYMEKVRNAGSVFIGKYCPEAVGDYYAGPNHTLPTSGTAKFSSPLSVDDFIKKTQFIYYTEEALLKAKQDIVDFAEREGLTAHGKSVSIRFEGSKQ